MKNKLFIGTSGYNYRDWKGKYYPIDLPQREWLPYYAREFDTVEINNSFYTAVKKETYSKWHDLTPANFQFVIKGHRYITQLKKLHDIDEATEHFFSAAEGLQEKLSCVLWQFPASFKMPAGREEEFIDRIQHFLSLLPKQVRHAFEFRDISLFTPEINKMLSQHNASLVISQSSKFPEVEMVNNTFAYIRFHGPTSLYSSGYSDAALQNWANKIKKYLETQDVYVYFNNDAGGWAIENVRTLKKFLKSNDS